MRPRQLPLDARIALLYVLFGAAWILATDGLLNLVVSDPLQQRTWQTYKGWVYVAASGLLLFGLLRHEMNLRRTTEYERDASDRDRAEALAQLNRFSKALDRISAYIYMKDRQHRYVYGNQSTLELFKVSRDELPGSVDSRFFPPETVQRLYAVDTRVLEHGQDTAEEIESVAPDGSRRVYWEVKTPMYDETDTNAIWGLCGISTDITDRKEAETRIRQLNRLHLALTRINQAIVRMRDRETLFSEICRAFVEHGEYHMAWIGLNDHTTERVRPVASAGEAQEYLAEVHISYLDNALGRGPTGTAIRAGQCIICQDIATDPRMAPWRDKALSWGFRSSAAVPIRLGGRPIGAFTVYALDPNAFTPEDENLLTETGANISFALDSLESEKERRRAEDALRDGENRLRVALSSASIAVFNMDRDLRYTWMYNPQLGYSPEQVIGRTDAELLPAEDVDAVTALKRRVLETGEEARGEVAIHAPTQTYHYDLRVEPLRDPDGAVIGLTGATLDITERKQSDEQLKLQATALEAAADAIVITDRAGTIQWVNPAFTAVTGYRLEESIGRNPRDLVRSGQHDQVFYEQFWNVILGGSIWRGEMINRRKDGTLYIEEQTIAPVFDARGEVTHFVAIKQDVTVRKQQERELAAVTAMVTALRSAHQLSEMLPVLLDEVMALVQAEGAALALLKTTGALIVDLGRGTFGKVTGLSLAPGEGVAGEVVSTGQPYINNTASTDPRLTPAEVPEPAAAVAFAPLIVQQNTIGVLWVSSRRPIEKADFEVLAAISDIAANALNRAALHEQTERRLRQISALHTVDNTIAGVLDLQLVLNVIIEQAIAQLNVDAVSILLLDPGSLKLRYVTGRGFRTRDIDRSQIRLNEGLTGRAAFERRILGITDLVAAGAAFDRWAMVQREGFVSYRVAPLVVKSQVRGVLEVFHRSPLDPDGDWSEFLEILAQQTAIAIDNAQLLESLQRTNAELSLAYDETIEGWSRALDLRDKETEGHTRRVTELCERLARAAGIGDSEMVHIRRGAILHDIGKMGIPDGVLLKPGPLTEEEWVVMRRHPQFAHDLLSPISYLGPALDIPYCHHEKWDGTGYPRGLKGEQIPLAARLFAVVDVWDALSSDRPYRQAWTKDKALEYIRAQAGVHFDPRVVPHFVTLINTL